MTIRSKLRSRRTRPVISVVVPVYNVEGYLGECLDSVLASRHPALDVVVVDDGSTDTSGAMADSYAARDARVRVLHTANAGLGAARNAGLAVATGQYLAFADSDDRVPRDAYSLMLRSLGRSGSDFATGSIARWEDGELHEPPWMRRLHNPARIGIRAADHPEVLGDVFAWNKLYRRRWWDELGLSWPEGVRYEDQPTTTRAYLGGRFDVLPDRVYHWRIRTDGSSITQQRASIDDLRDRWATKKSSLDAVLASDQTDAVLDFFLDRVLAGDLHRYFVLIPDADDAWWELLRSGIEDIWGSRGRSLATSGLTPEHREIGVLVEQGDRDEAARLASRLT